MKSSIKKGVGFGLTSGIITTLGLMIGLYSSTNSKSIVIGGILIIAITDAFSDAFGIHISEEISNKKVKPKHVWEATLSTFFAKFVFALSFIIPLLLFELLTAVIVGAAWGILALGFISIKIAKKHKAKTWKVVFEHVFTAMIVIIATYFLGVWINSAFI